ncbi:hypothetical protein [Sporosarcina ureae]|uniref:Uncharacterized protein n=1 Tax=Sporosarcina ureae TaxID=1571 RepID=A0ABM6JUJ4_SPOUR|nr:hypothetical protein [Sporosarcina ureae]ARF13829.1 hypothetical protein SporoS204_06525 [Sporosarcina ureae]
MALSILEIMYIVLIVLAIGIQVVLYKSKSNNSVIIINMLFGLLLSYLAFTTFPSNFAIQRTLAVVMGIVAILAVVIKFRSEELVLLSKIALSISILVSLALLFL